MRHGVDGKQFGRNSSHRAAMLKNMANCVVDKERIVTTVTKAKEVRRVVDRLITLAKKGTPHARRLAFDRTRDDALVKKLFELAAHYKGRPGGYTRVMKLSDRRWGDAAEMAVLELVDRPEIKRGKIKVEGAQEGGEAPESKDTKATDPFKRFRKLFKGGAKAETTPKVAKPKAEKPVKAKAEKKEAVAPKAKTTKAKK